MKEKELEDLKYIARAAKAFILESRKVGISIPLDLQDHFEDLSECFEDEGEAEWKQLPLVPQDVEVNP